MLKFVIAFLLLASTAAAAETIVVPSGGNLQAALTSAQPGDVIVLSSGSIFVGQFKFPPKTGTVTLTTENLPARRITPADQSLLATVRSGVGAMAFDLADAKNWVIDGIRFEGNEGGYGEVISLQRAENIILRRLLIDMPDAQEQKRFILGNGKNITLTQSYCSGIWRTGQDSQCFVAWDGPGPYVIRDNFLEAASENVMFGGADSSSPENIPADILVEGNLFSKRMSWFGQPRVVKNLFELKAAKRVVIRDNVFENIWPAGQAGYAFQITPRNQDGKAPWTVIEDVLIERNTIRNAAGGFNILGVDGLASSGRTTRLTIRRNILQLAGNRAFMIGGEAGSVSITENEISMPVVDEAWKSQPLMLYLGSIFLTGESSSRMATHALLDLTWAGNTYPSNSCIFGDNVGCGEIALKTLVKNYSLVLPSEPVPTPTPEIDLLKQELAQTKASLTNTQNELAELTVRVQALINHFSGTPTMTKVLDVIKYLRAVPR